MVKVFSLSFNLFYEICEGFGYTVELIFQSFISIRKISRRTEEIIRQLFIVTIGSMPITFISAFFSGMIMALQMGLELKKFGQQELIGMAVSEIMTREMGPVFTAIAVTGLVGSMFAAQIGTMKVSEEIDALRVMSIDPSYYLVMPRIIALSFALPVLTIYSDVIGIASGAVVGKTMLNVSFDIYFSRAREILELKDIYGGILKSLVFGIVISGIACAQGMQAQHGAEDVGRATLRTVVISFIFILFFDYVIGWALYELV